MDRKSVDDIVTTAGRALASSLKQMGEGNWKDGSGKPVEGSEVALACAAALLAIVVFRVEYLGYENPFLEEVEG